MKKAPGFCRERGKQGDLCDHRFEHKRLASVGRTRKMTTDKRFRTQDKRHLYVIVYKVRTLSKEGERCQEVVWGRVEVVVVRNCRRKNMTGGKCGLGSESGCLAGRQTIMGIMSKYAQATSPGFHLMWLELCSYIQCIQGRSPRFVYCFRQ